MTRAGALRVPILVFLGSLLFQVAWTIALPAFGGIDEFDHSYRAAAVARGQWVAPASDATRGTGAVMHVPRDIVEAASRQCKDLPYTRSVDCEAQSTLSSGLVTVASGAGRYNPVYYWFAGTPAQMATGADALYIMRLATGLICSALLGLAAWALQLWSRTIWPLVGLLVGMTPVAVYSTSIVAPNGVEITAAAALWCSLAGFGRPGLSTAAQRRLLTAATVSAVVLATVRSLGPLWLAVVVLVAALVHGWRPLWAAVRDNRLWVAACTGVVSLALAASLVWIRSQDSLVIGRSPVKLTHPVKNTVVNVPLWFFQGVAAFPTRGEQAPAVVYACCVTVILTLVVVGWRSADRTLRIAFIATGVASLGIPLAIGIATFAEFGAAWQGRYGLPVAIGLILLPAFALELAGYRHRLQQPLLMSAVAALATAHVVSIVDVFRRTHAGDPHLTWIFPHQAAMVLLASAACVVWVLAVRQLRTNQHEHAVDRTVREPHLAGVTP